MTSRRTRLVVPVLALVALLLAAPAAHAWSTSLSAPVTRAGSRVGTAKGTLVLAHNGWAIDSVRAVGFRAPAANRSWRARTVLVSSCIEPGFDPAMDDPASVRSVEVTVASPWRTTRIAGTTGTITTTDVVKECPAGLVPGSTIMLRLAIQPAGGGAAAGSALLFAAG